MRRCRCPPVACRGGYRSAAGRGWGGKPAAPRRDGLSRLPDLGHLPRAEAGVPKPCVRQSPGGHLSERRAQRCSRSVAAGPGDPSVRLAPGSLLALHFFFFSLSSLEGYFILKRNFFPSLLFPTRIQTPTVERGMYVFAPDWAGGAPGRRRRSGPQLGPRAFPRLPGGL